MLLRNRRTEAPCDTVAVQRSPLVQTKLDRRRIS
jgi:hypothetical protein